MRCRSGTTALKGNLPEKASSSFQDALALNPYLWEAFEGLCALGKSYVTFKMSFRSSYRPQALFLKLMRSFPLGPTPLNEHHQKIFRQRQYRWPLVRDFLRLIQAAEAISFVHGNQIYLNHSRFEWFRVHETQCKCTAAMS